MTMAAPGQRVGSPAGGGVFEARPFGPEIDARGGFHHFGDVGPAHAATGFQKIELAVFVATDELGVRRAGLHPKGPHHLAHEALQGPVVFAIVGQGSGAENATAVGHFHGRGEVLRGLAKQHLPLERQGIHVVHVAGLELLHQVAVALVAQPVDDAPELLLGVYFFDTGGAGFAARLHHPGRSRGVGEVIDGGVVEQPDERRHPQARIPGLHAHGQLVAEVTRGGLPHAGAAKLLAQVGRFLHIEIIEGHDAVDDVLAHQPGHAIGHILVGLQCIIVRGNVKNLVQTLAGPGLPLQVFAGDEVNGIARRLAGFQKRDTFEVSRDAEEGHVQSIRMGRETGL